jgi:NADH-quinone oxidoreductase subunit N
MNPLLSAMLPEIILATVACVCFLVGVSNKAGARKLAAHLALWTLVAVTLIQMRQGLVEGPGAGSAARIFAFGHYIKLLSSAVGILLVLLNMPTNAAGTGGSSSDFGADTGEFFGLLLLSLAGLFTVASANDIILLFLGIELASIPTYVMVSISRPLPVAQEAGVKYFFLGAMAAAVLLFGFSYLYGTTGQTGLDGITASFAGWAHPEWQTGGVAAGYGMPGPLSEWQLLAVLMLIAGLAFKMAAVPLYEYVGDVYQGAATPVTALLAFVPKTAGFVALIKVLYAVSGGAWAMPEHVVKLLWVLAALTMTFGNVLGLLQFNIKRVLAYSSVAHTGYMLVGVTALISTSDPTIHTEALHGVLFYLAAYGIMNSGAFGVLMLLPPRHDRPATSAETFDDLAGTGRKHIGLGLAMAVACFSLTGLPLTVGFFGKLYLIQPALHAGLNWLVVILVINAAISAAYYLRIVAAMFLRPEPGPGHQHAALPTVPFAQRLLRPTPVLTAVGLSVVATLLFGIFLPATGALSDHAEQATVLDSGRMPMVPAAAALVPPSPAPAAMAPGTPIALAKHTP